MVVFKSRINELFYIVTDILVRKSKKDLNLSFLNDIYVI